MFYCLWKNINLPGCPPTGFPHSVFILSLKLFSHLIVSLLHFSTQRYWRSNVTWLLIADPEACKNIKEIFLTVKNDNGDSRACMRVFHIVACGIDIHSLSSFQGVLNYGKVAACDVDPPFD